MDRATVEVYERQAAEWQERRRRPVPASLGAFAARAPVGVRADVGCGPGWHAARLGDAVLAFDAAVAMAQRVRAHAPGAWPVVADLERLPVRPGALAGAWAHRSYQHIPAERLPLALAEVHRALAPGGALHVQVTSDRRAPTDDGDPFPGRHFTWWVPERLRDVVEGAGFTVDAFVDDGAEWLDVEATRAPMLPDTVGPAMRVLIVGLNPSVYSADAGVGFARPGNRFWPAAYEAGLVSRTHDPYHACRADGVGMTNLVRRATARADELSRDEYVAGAERLARLVGWLRPAAVCFVGITGYRAAVDRKARTGWQEQGFAGVPAYVMPNTSGLNAHAKPADFVAHLRAVQRPPA